MTAKDPAQRPTADEALNRFQSIVKAQSYFTLRRRLVGVNEAKGFKSVVFENVAIFMDAALIPVKFVFGVPSRTMGAVRGLITSKTSKKKN